MRLNDAKATLDKVIRKARVHFYKPFQIAEILRRHRIGELDDLTDLDSYKNASYRWRDEVTQRLVGRSSTSSARYQADVFNDNACPPEALAALGDYNKANRGQVEAYIYRMFEARVSTLGEILNEVRRATPESFDVSKVVEMFQLRPGLKRSIDKVYEITVYALFSAIVRDLRLQVSLSIANVDRQLIIDFGDFLEKIVGLPKGETTLTLPARLFRLGSTNAADRGLDMIANFGPAIQVKHLTLDSDHISDICEGITADRIVIVCKESEVTVVDAVIKQLGLHDRLQALITFNDLKAWYGICLSVKYRESLGKSLLADFIREFSNEFPSLAGLPAFLNERGYSRINLAGIWSINAERVGC